MRYALVFASLAVIMLSVGAVFFFAIPLEVQTIEAGISLAEGRAAFNLTRDSSFMHFGTINLENKATRAVTLENIRDRPITATIYIEGPGWLSVSENRVRIGPGEQREVVFTADPTADTAYGSYTWNVSVVYRRW